MASAVARAYNGGMGAEPTAGPSRGSAPGQRVCGAKPPEAESLFVFVRPMVQYFAVFITFSGDNCMTLTEIDITW